MTALTSLLGDDAHAESSTDVANWTGLASPRHVVPKAKRVIFMFMQGGPSHLETFDHKPELEKSGGKKVGGKAMLAPIYKFNPHGKSGLMISEVYPHLAKHADELCLLNGMHTTSPAHPQAAIALHTGSQNFVRPSMGAWITYGLGTVNQNLPGFVTINPLGRLGGAQNYGCLLYTSDAADDRFSAHPHAVSA